MQFDLDLVWIRDERIVGITPNVPAPAASVPESQLPSYPSPGRIDAVLEVPAGTAAERGWDEGAALTRIPCAA
jgi:uncharacterized membrane protein (UPF0127 family)